ncbi:uncharacterized protein LODBEIA_P25910 [Lodderomyces beijingensis]|uniref:F-box domain-containing protein n=1 Tax=Lodderomyces beijingensis TaxID=1775926 RepID=A0ABP0ZJQ2_9ASCO
MGFIEPGRPLYKKERFLNYKYILSSPRRLRATSRNLHKPKSHDTSDPIASSMAPRKCFESLPFNIICEIFVLAGPNNNLPLVNKNMYKNLQFSGDGTDRRNDEPGDEHSALSSWNNISLVFSMIKRYFLFDLNTMIGSGAAVLDCKIDFYQGVLDEFSATYIECERSGFYQLFARNVQIVRDLWAEYKCCAGRFVLEESLLNYRFLSKALLEKLTSKNLRLGQAEDGDEDEEMEMLRFKSRDEIELNRQLRLKFLRFKFWELDVLRWHAEVELRSGRFEDVSQYRDFAKYLQLLNGTQLEVNEDEASSNPPLPHYEDDDVTTCQGFTLDETTYYHFEFGYCFGRTFFGETAAYTNRCRIPRHLYLKSIKSLRAFQLLESLTYLIPNVSTDCDRVLSDIVYTLDPSRIHFDMRVPFLSVIILVLHDGGEPDSPPTRLLGSLMEAFSLYDKYSKLDYKSYGTNSKGQDVLENLYDGIKYMCLYLLGSETDEILKEHKRQLWTLVLKLKNYDLTHLLSKFAESPDLDILSQQL